MKVLSIKTGIPLILILLFFTTGSVYGQKNLDFYIQTALKNSPLLKEYKSQVELNRIDSLRLKAGLGIQANANSYNMYAPVIKGWGYDNAITDGANVSALISVSKELTSTQKRKNQYEAFSLQNQSIRNTGKITEQELKKNISLLYITAYGSWQQVQFSSEMLNFMVQQRDILKRLTETGSLKPTGFLSFMVNLQQQELLAEQAKQQYKNDFAFLNYACGISDTSSDGLAEPNLKAAQNTDFTGSVFYHQFVIDSLKLVIADQQIDFSYQPKISLVADGGYLTSLAVLPHKNFGISAGVSVNIPLYDGGQRKMQHDQVAINQLTRMDYRDFYSSQYREQTNQLWQQLQAKQAMEQKINQQVGYAKSLVDAYQKLLEKGDVQLTEYLLSLGNYLSAKNMLMENSIEKYKIMNELNYWNRSK